MIGRELLSLENRDLAGLDIGRADEDLDIRAGAHAIEVDERVDRVPLRIVVERVHLGGTKPWGDDVRPGPEAPEAEHPAEKAALGRCKGSVEAGPAPEGFELAPRTVYPAPEPALHHHDGVHGAGARTGDCFDGEAPVFEEGVEHAPREAPWAPPPWRASDTDFRARGPARPRVSPRWRRTLPVIAPSRWKFR